MARAVLRPSLVQLLRLRIRLTRVLRPSDLRSTMLWAGIVGVLGALSSMVFRSATVWMRWLYTGRRSGLVETAISLPGWARVPLGPLVTKYFSVRAS